MHIKSFSTCVLLLYVASKCAVTLSNKEPAEDFSKVFLDLSNIAIEGGQNERYNRKYEPRVPPYPSYYKYEKPHKYRYGYPQSISQDYSPLYFSHQNHPQNYPSYKEPFYCKPPFFQQARMSVMDALFSIAQNDDLQCVPKIVCEVAAGGLTGREAGFGSPVNVGLESLASSVLTVIRPDMSPVLHFGKAAVLGISSKGNTKSCEYAYPECPNDPDKLIKYLNNHKGGFFRFFQELNPSYQKQKLHHQKYGHYFSGCEQVYSRKKAFAEERIQNSPSDYINNNFDIDAYYKRHRGLSFPNDLPSSASRYEEGMKQNVVFPSSVEGNREYAKISRAKTIKFPIEDSVEPHRRPKEFYFDIYPSNKGRIELDIQKPLPNHVPTPDIFPDRTGTGELKLDIGDLEKNYQQSLPYRLDHYTQLLYDSFPNDENYKANL